MKNDDNVIGPRLSKMIDRILEECAMLEPVQQEIALSEAYEEFWCIVGNGLTSSMEKAKAKNDKAEIERLTVAMRVKERRENGPDYFRSKSMTDWFQPFDKPLPEGDE